VKIFIEAAVLTSESRTVTTAYRKKRPKRKPGSLQHCHCCGGQVPFCWTCRCGFAICQACMAENFWGMSCNGIIWQCPDCGQWNGFGNQ